MPDSSPVIRSKEFLENVIDAVREPLVVLDQDLRVLSVSRAFYEVFLVKPNQTIGKLIYELGNRQWDIPRLRELLEDILPQQSTFKDYEVVHTFSGIGQRTMLLNARQIKRALGKKKIILLAIEDITARKVIETNLARTRKELELLQVSEVNAREFAQSIIDTIREPLIALDQDLRIVAASRAFYEVFRGKPEDTLGELIYDLGNRQWDIPKLRELLEAILLQSTTFNDYEVIHDFTTIGRRTMLLNARQVKRSLGRERIILLAIEDVTDRRLMEAELEKSQRVESLGVLAGGIAHDFNNLMAGLLANIEMVRLYLQEHRYEEASVRLEKTPAIFLRGRALTQRLLTFSKGGAPRRAPTALGPFFQEWVEFALIGSDITAELQVDTDLKGCLCDVGQIGQVMSNLLINARQASPPGGVVRVKVFNSQKLGASVSVQISNDGPGIAPEIMGRIFDPFFTTKSEGSGLGLAIAFSILRQHNGWIEVASVPGEGALLTVILPAITEGSSPLVISGPAEPFRGTGLALVMDDDEAIRDAVGHIMEGLGFEVLRTANGSETLEVYHRCQREGREVETFLLDNQIPGEMGGLLTSQKLREAGSHARIVLMSGHFHAASGVPFCDGEGLFRLAKPFNLQELSQVLASTS